MIWGEARATAGKKKRSASWPGKKTHQPVGQERKLNTNSLAEAPPKIINGPSLTLPSAHLKQIKVIFYPFTMPQITSKMIKCNNFGCLDMSTLPSAVLRYLVEWSPRLITKKILRYLDQTYYWGKITYFISTKEID